MKTWQMASLGTALGIMLLLQACATAAPAIPAGFVCPQTMADYKPGVSDAAVKHCLGEPGYVNHNPDGRFIYMYDVNGGINMGGTTFAFLFDSSGSLIRVNAYQSTKK